MRREEIIVRLKAAGMALRRFSRRVNVFDPLQVPRPKRAHLTRLGVTLGEVSRCLADEHRLAMRQRLRALQLVLRGATVARAADAAGVSKAVVERWLRTVRADGIDGLLIVSNGTRRDTKTVEGHSDHAVLRKRIAQALAVGANWRMHKRLAVAARVLAGEKIDRVAQDALVSVDTIRQWLRDLREGNLRRSLSEAERRTRRRRGA